MGFSNHVSKLTEKIWGTPEDAPDVNETASKAKLKTVDVPPLKTTKETIDSKLNLLSEENYQLKERLTKILQEESIDREQRIAQLKKEISQGSYKPEAEEVADSILSYALKDK